MSTDRNDSSTPAEKSGSPTVTGGGVMPGGSDLNGRTDAYPEATATDRGSLPAAIADSIGDATGNQSRDRLLVVAQAQGITSSATMNRAELAEALTGTMSPTDLATALAR